MCIHRIKKKSVWWLLITVVFVIVVKMKENKIAQAADSMVCGQPIQTVPNQQNRNRSEASGEELCGSVTMAGSTAMEKMAGILAESFMLRYPGVTVTSEYTGSSAGIAAVLAGSADIGNSSRSLRKDEKDCGAVGNIVALDGIAVVTDADNPVVSLTTEQLTDIYTGKIRNWQEVGGTDEAIVVIGREAGSGTRCAFEKLLEIEERCAYANELDSTGAVMARAATVPGAVGYVSLDVLDDTVHVLAIDGIKPTQEAIQSGSYLLQRPFIMVTDGELSVQSKEVRAFFSYLKSKEGQKLIRSVGLVPVDAESK